LRDPDARFRLLPWLCSRVCSGQAMAPNMT
jgi:hypothetical protein